LTARRRLALVTGGCHRLGAAIAGALAEAGWDLALHASTACQLDAALLARLDAAGAAWTVTQADFSDPDQALCLADRVADTWGKAPGLLVNNAAVLGDDRIETTTADALMNLYAINCAAPALLSRAFAALSGGDEAADRSIVNILDQRIAHPHGDQLAYTLSKLALAGLTRIAAVEFAPRIRVNAVAPGLTIATPDYSGDTLDALARKMPLGHLTPPADVGAAVVYLANAKSTTGQTLFVDAGAGLVSWRRDFLFDQG